MTLRFRAVAIVAAAAFFCNSCAMTLNGVRLSSPLVRPAAQAPGSPSEAAIPEDSVHYSGRVAGCIGALVGLCLVGAAGYWIYKEYFEDEDDD